MTLLMQRVGSTLRSLREAFAEHRESLAAVVSLVYPMTLGYGAHYLVTLSQWQLVGAIFGAAIGIMITVVLWPRVWDRIPPVFRWLLPMIGYPIGYALGPG